MQPVFVHKKGQDGDEKFLSVSMVQCAHFVCYILQIFIETHKKICCNEKCQAFCLHHTMETLSYILMIIVETSSGKSFLLLILVPELEFTQRHIFQICLVINLPPSLLH